MSQSESLLVFKDWKIGAHPLFVDQLVKLIDAVEQERAIMPNFTGNTKLRYRPPQR